MLTPQLSCAQTQMGVQSPCVCHSSHCGLGTAAQCHLPLVTSVCSGLSEDTEVTWTALTRA